MVRRRDIRTRVRDLGRKRGPRRPPGPGWTIAELERFSHVTRRTIAEYIRRGLLSPPEFRGTATRYQRHHLLRLLAIRLMKADGTSRLGKIQRTLLAMGDRQIETWVLSRHLSAEAAQALKQPEHDATNASRPASSNTRSPAGGTPAESAVPTQTWERAVLMPGLELSWRKDAGPLVERIAKRFAEQLLQVVHDATSQSEQR